jgi:ribosomal protein S6
LAEDPLKDGQKNMKHYEYTYLTRQDIDEAGAKSLQDKLTASIEAKKGVIVDLMKAYKKRLAYRIKKQEAAYVNAISFQMEPANAVDFKKETDIIVEILRGLIISYDPERLKREIRPERPITEERTAQVITPAEQTAPTIAKKEEPIKTSGTIKEEKPEEEKPAKPRRKTKIKAELRDIEEKLEEILK